MFSVHNLHSSVDDKEILKGVSLEVPNDKVHALMGKNGSGKSTLAQSIMGNPSFIVTEGKITLDGKSILELEPTDRAKEGIFLSFQYPSEVSGVNIASYLRLIYNKSHSTSLSPVKFRELLKEKMEVLHIKEDFLSRYLNEGFSGGEKKRMEMLQMLVLEPKMVILDEVDSGLDIDAVKIVANAVEYLRKTCKSSILIITHYSRILNYIKPDKVHIMQDGLIIKTGGEDLAHELEAKGYAHLE
ncbi:Fe-S cluster assembly ATPase SufC [candidate division WWE3 bacterium RIFOXYD1_FULL_39_9]|uniref:Fe-S cluster assembly ATPase SufC n=1 Tax=candidate division WWE3 bacterium RIFOXYD1_FULL_39_9 TaxID=1802649 RepID=A0A1F4X598_UNCKA|nr:MAG: Fe-S cluster assembly ATPase SufC [candidate division WWE3 bacterium RIFOXYD1_FULL_39_9]